MQAFRRHHTVRALALVTTLLVRVSAAGEPGGDDTEPTGTLTLREVVALALAGNPELRAVSREVRVREALSLQAGALPNPELRGEVENVGGSGAREGFEDTESTLRVSQVIELGGKRAARRRVAESERDLALRDHEAKRLAVVADATKTFITTLAAQQRLALATEIERLARETVAAVQRSIAAGASAPVETTRALVALGRAGVGRAKADRELEAARALLAATWGSATPRFRSVEGDLTHLGRLPSEAELRRALERNPDLVRWAMERSARRTALALERARRVPDVTVGAGARHFSDNGDNALVVDLTVPLPLFDRNAGSIAAARERLAQVRDETEAATVSARAALAEAYQHLVASHEEASALDAQVLPEARRTVSGTLDALRKGLLRPVDVIEAQRTLFETEREYLSALEQFHLAAADIERLTAAPLPARTDGGDR